MLKKVLKRTLLVLASIIAFIAIVLVVAGFVFEAKFRPKDSPPPEVPPSLGYFQGKIAEPTGWIPFVLPGIPDAKIQLTPGDKHAVTDDDGMFKMDGITPGMYRVSISAKGYDTTNIDGVAIGGGVVTTLPDEALYPEITGPPKARLKVGSLISFKEPPAEYPYLTTVFIDATESENISRNGIRFEIRDELGNVLMDPYAKEETPLQIERSPIPGTSPALFLFKPPAPGEYTVKVFLTNDKAPGVVDSAETTVRAINTPPEAFPTVMAGPNPPQKIPTKDGRTSSGLKVVTKGTDVYLMGLGLDRNYDSPELYNPGGFEPDVYGKNHDYLQRQFGFEWQLYHVNPATSSRTVKNALLQRPDGQPATEGQFLRFSAEQPGRYEAVLKVHDRDPSGSLASEEATVSILSLEDKETYDGSSCAACHKDRVDGYNRTAHKEMEIGCESCHGPAAGHLAIKDEDEEQYHQNKRATMDVSLESGVCGQCHDKYGEWEKTRHSDGMSYGYYEIARPLLVDCTRCHYARTFKRTVELARETGKPFHDVRYKIRAGGIGPLMPDFSKVPNKDETGISCTACHSPHDMIQGKSHGIRTDSVAELCQTCHHEKWQNTIMEGNAGKIGNGFEYPNEKYAFDNPHNTESKCNKCHLGNQTETLDALGVRAVGGHTLRMRDTGPNGTLGGFGPKPDDPSQNKDPEDTDDILHLAPCRDCHEDLDTFNRNGVQAAVYKDWVELGELLKKANNTVLPNYKPGDKCAICHRGGTLPFDDDPSLILESAYTNYKLIKNDRSWGVHNTKYSKKILADSIDAVKAYLEAHGQNGGSISDGGLLANPDSF
ncbi:MAG: hypothetical protein GY762_19185 [Proteobacteria bacterium]|nr:hypothetical protein [Pseudomonadota bacterium]